MLKESGDLLLPEAAILASSSSRQRIVSIDMTSQQAMTRACYDLSIKVIGNFPSALRGVASGNMLQIMYKSKSKFR